MSGRQNSGIRLSRRKDKDIAELRFAFADLIQAIANRKSQIANEVERPHNARWRMAPRLRADERDRHFLSHSPGSQRHGLQLSYQVQPPTAPGSGTSRP